MPYRQLSNSLTWHWCHNCAGLATPEFSAA